VLARRRSTRPHNRPMSMVSIYTENEIQELAEFMSDIADIGDSSHWGSEPSSPVMSSRTQAISSLDSGHYSTTTISDSDPEQSSSTYITRSRPSRISMEPLRSPPSLTWSTSYSSLSTEPHAPSVPLTPLTSASELFPSDLTMIDERHSDDYQLTPDNLDTFASTHELLPQAWPQQKSNIHWTVSSQLESPESPSSPTINTPNSDQSNSPMSPYQPPTPRSSSTVSFASFLTRSRKQSLSDETRAAMLEEKRLKKALKKEEARAKKEKATMERRKREEQIRKQYRSTSGHLTDMHPLVLGTMLAMGQ
jgi:hypothetical protein